MAGKFNTFRELMKKLLLICFFFVLKSNNGFCQQTLTTNELNKIVESIRKTEGNPNYGILSIKVGTNYTLAKKLCENTVRNNFKRWQKQNKENNFILFLGSKYCPPSADKIGFHNWTNNMTKILGQKFIKEFNNKYEY